ncbi:calcium/sodium antiporter [Bengtsoniella intestinalis]|uniref:calcium/sodium antiporter n=1 Tax=Bengtsoniella intestinalis TaxID=3073143 RepID=UPI00391F8D21
MSILYLILGFLLLIWGADRFVSGATALAQKWGVSNLIIGLTVVAFGTSAPELAVSVSASLAGANEIALGNVLGSNLFNLLVVAGLSAIMAPLVVDKTLLCRDWVASLLATLALLGLIIDGRISRGDATVLLLGFVTIMALQIRNAKTSHQEDTPPCSTSNRTIAQNIVSGLSAIVIGGQLSVHGATELARQFGVSETVIGLTIVAIGTSLPELVTSLVATKRGETGIAIGNVIGSNLFNVLFILGLSCFITPMTVAVTAVYDTAILLVVTTGMLMLAKQRKLNRLCGCTLALLYVGYTLWLLVR